jgi:hypothetical protein
VKSIDFVAALVSVSLIAIFAIFMAMFGADEVVSLRKQAIEHGYAEYVIDSDGKTTWQWKEKQ